MLNTGRTRHLASKTFPLAMPALDITYPRNWVNKGVRKRVEVWHDMPPVRKEAAHDVHPTFGEATGAAGHNDVRKGGRHAKPDENRNRH
eukprot:3540858-Alexandrium_andersonii.AAC.1